MKRLLPIGLFVAFALAAVAPLRNYDLFWHLAAGKWIVGHGALPLVDPFALASDRHAWINGEWLFEVVAYALHAAVGLAGLSCVRGIAAALVFTLAFLFAKRESGEHTALLLTAIAFAGAMPTFDLRPSSVAMLLLVLAIGTRSAIAQAAIALVWIQIHPSALLAPLVAALRTRKATPVIASAVALLVNPFGFRAIVSPIELMAFVGRGEFVNAEWLPSPPAIFPLLYVCVVVSVVGAVLALSNPVERGKQWWRVVLLALFAWLAIRHVRNQGLFFAAFPMLVGPMVGRYFRADRIRPAIVYAGAVLAIAFVAFTADHRLGVSPERFPIRAVARLQAAGLAGNIYNPDQFGGYLIWSFYPQRRTLTDGRNELYHSYIPEYARARGDGRAWQSLLDKYRIAIAVEEYLPPIEVIDAVTRKSSAMPASLAYWPREQWALIAFDDAAMVFARRADFPRGVIDRWELRGIVPDAPRSRQR